MSERLQNDVDPIETRDWLQAIESVIREEGVERAQYLIDQLLSEARKGGVNVAAGSAARQYINTIPVEEEPEYPGNLELERRIRSAIRWNAIMTVLRASKKDLELGGHMASFQSSATVYEVCFNHFFRARNDKDGGDLVYFQGHISPGVYARAFLEGRLTEEQMNNFRQEVHGNGLSSYPHPKLMPEFWQFPTVSMGLGPIGAIYQAKFLKYLEHRGLKDTSEQTFTRSSATVKWMSRNLKAPSPSRPAKNWTTWSSSSTATCSVWTARSPVTAKSSTNWKASSKALAGTLSR